MTAPSVPAVTGRGQPWELLSTRPGPAGYLKVTTGTYRMPDGSQADWDILTGPGSVAVLALTDAGEVILARHYRPGPDAVLDELPGGMLEGEESVAEAAARELLDETGYAGQIQVVGHTWLSAAATRRCWAAVAAGCHVAGGQALDPGEEFCLPVLMPLAAFREHLRSGQVTDAGTGYMAPDHLGLL